MSQNIHIQQALLDAVNDAFMILGDAPKETHENILVDGQEHIISSIFLKGHLVGKGSMIIPLADAAKVVSHMLDSDVEETSIDCQDGIGEMTNMIIGGCKTKCAGHNIHFDISVPMTRISEVITSEPTENKHTIVKSFLCNDIRFRIIFSYKQQQKETPAPEAAKPKLSAAELLMQAMAKAQQKK